MLACTKAASSPGMQSLFCSQGRRGISCDRPSHGDVAEDVTWLSAKTDRLSESDGPTGSALLSEALCMPYPWVAHWLLKYPSTVVGLALA
jgi:hypothetical protein